MILDIEVERTSLIIPICRKQIKGPACKIYRKKIYFRHTLWLRREMFKVSISSPSIKQLKNRHLLIVQAASKIMSNLDEAINPSTASIGAENLLRIGRNNIHSGGPIAGTEVCEAGGIKSLLLSTPPHLRMHAITKSTAFQDGGLSVTVAIGRCAHDDA